MKILVVCGAGASSTFVAQRLRHAAHADGFDCSAVATTLASLPIDLDASDLVLVGPHLADQHERIVQDAAIHGAAALLLPPDIFTDRDGTRTLALVRTAASTDGFSTPPSSPSREDLP
jgi:PTS system cellobiose-specific IIB component